HGYVAARHVADFGHVICGATKKRTFRVVNTGRAGAVSWAFDKALLAGSGFALEPDRVARLPEGAAASVTATFQARRAFENGPREVALPIAVKNGPATLLVLRACVAVPAVAVSAALLEFGDVVVGRSCTSCLQLHNPGPVPADWELKAPLNISDARDEARFEVAPRGGRLAPGARANVAVEFVPLEGQAYATKLPLRVANSAKTHMICLQGVGVHPRVAFDPPRALLGPVLPGAPWARAIVAMRNDGAVPIEVFSLDFDAQYGAEERALAVARGYDERDVLRVPPRQPGEGL
ncbi:hypothetical protein JKP88DRAFT_130991, partial [Tribonema minus]